MNQQEVLLSREPVALFKILKFENLAASGGEAKQFISEGRVRVNGRVETRKARKMRSGDVIECHGMVMKLIAGPKMVSDGSTPQGEAEDDHGTQ